VDDGNPKDTADTQEQNTEITRVIDSNRGKSPFNGLQTERGNTDTRCKIGVPSSEGNEDKECVFLP
jgi:hypothetical protein